MNISIDDKKKWKVISISYISENGTIEVKHAPNVEDVVEEINKDIKIVVQENKMNKEDRIIRNLSETFKYEEAPEEIELVTMADFEEEHFKSNNVNGKYAIIEIKAIKELIAYDTTANVYTRASKILGKIVPTHMKNSKEQHVRFASRAIEAFIKLIKEN